MTDFNPSAFIAAANQVMQSGTHNFSGCRIPVFSRVNINSLAGQLRGYHDVQLCQFMKFGWPINVRHAIPPSKPRGNHKGATDHPDQIDQYIAKELQHGAIIGPLQPHTLVKSVRVSPLNTRPKKDSQERRVIVDLSFAGPLSVNGAVEMEHYMGCPINLTYPGVDDLMRIVLEKGHGCALFKRDLKRTYRQIPVDPGDVYMLGYTWKGATYADRVLPMGLRSAAYICQRITNAIQYICTQRGVSIVNYLDDFAGAETWDKAQEAFCTVHAVLTELGFQEATDKACAPKAVMEFLGIEFHTQSLTLHVTPQRMLDIEQGLREWERKTQVNKTELQSLIGKLLLVAKCVRPGRLFVGRLLELLRSLPDNKRHTLHPEYRKDITWWQHFMRHFSGVRAFPPSEWSRPDQFMATDACLSGAGGICMGEYFRGKFPESWAKDRHINELELATVAVALRVWAHKLRGIRISVFCDNAATVTTINTLKSRSSRMLHIMRGIAYTCATGEFEIKAVHIPGVENRVPDWLSRWECGSQYRQAFAEWNSKANLRQVTVPASEWSLEPDW